MSQTKEVENSLTQASYKPTQYLDQSWEVIGQIEENPVFESLEIPVVSTSEDVFDPMFADYGGRTKDGLEKRLHQPAHLSTGRATEERKKALLEDESKIKISEQDLKKLIAEAEERGKSLGLALAIEEQNSKLANIENRIFEVVKDIGHQLAENIQHIEREAAELAIAISKKIFNQAVEVNPEYIINIIDESIQQAGSASIKKIKISPEDMEFINVVGISKRLREFDERWQFEADATVKAGCIVETSAGTIDFQLDKAWERLKDQIVKVL
jgi:flagellar biosynthesis/type III secretory pathway protein FliH